MSSIYFLRGAASMLFAAFVLCLFWGCSSEPPPNPELVVVPAGWFEMGRPYDSEGQPDELPVHTVYLDEYGIGKYPVTNREYVTVLNWALSRGYLQNQEGGPYDGGKVYAYNKPIAETFASAQGALIRFSGGDFEALTRDGHNGTAFPMDDHPAVLITWYGAAAYTNWLSEMNGLTPCYDTDTWERIRPVPNGYRLPTEAEWERAAAWDGRRHWRYGVTSDTLEQSQANFYEDTYANPLELRSMPYTAPVGWYNGTNPVRLSEPDVATQDAASPAGAYDMAGNTWDWCHDWYDAEYYAGSGLANPLGASSGAYRVGRGGSWRYPRNHCRAADRYWNWPDYNSRYQGLRVAISPPPETP